VTVAMLSQMPGGACRQTLADGQAGGFSDWDATTTAATKSGGGLNAGFEHTDTMAAHVGMNPSNPASDAQSSAETPSQLAASDSSAVAVSSVRAERIWAATWQCFDTVPGSSPVSPAPPKGSAKVNSHSKTASALAEVPPPSQGTPISRAQLALQARTFHQALHTCRTQQGFACSALGSAQHCPGVRLRVGSMNLSECCVREVVVYLRLGTCSTHSTYEHV